MSEVIVITSGKGGVGKTTTVANLGTALSLENKKTVVNKARAKKQQNFTPTNSFEDMINEFKKASDERLFDANKKVEQRRGKSYHKGNA